MLISRTPYRISFFGGGTDYHTWYQKHGGAVLSTTINKYCYITARFLPPFFPNKSRIVWSKIEEVINHSDISHPAVKAVLSHLGIDQGVEIHTTGDLPSRSGLGSSSTFTVGLLNVMAALQDRTFNKSALALESVRIERDILQENVGIQDQIAASYGGLNKTEIFTDGGFFINSVKLPFERINELQDHLLLFFTGVSRSATDIAIEQINSQKDGKKEEEMHRMRSMVETAIGILKYNIDIPNLDGFWMNHGR